ADTSRRPALDQAWAFLKEGNGAQAAREAERVLDSAKTAELKREAGELVIRAYIQQGSFEEARERLNRFEALFGPDPHLEGLLLVETGEVRRAIILLTEAFENQKSERAGYMLAHAFIKSKRFEEALELCSDPRLSEFVAPICTAIQAE